VTDAKTRLEFARIKVLRFGLETAVLYALILYCGVATVMEWWPIDWLTFAQHQLFGSFNVPLSGVVVFLVVLAIQSQLWDAIVGFVTRRIAARDAATDTIVAPSPPSWAPSQTLSESQLAGRWIVGIVSAIWIGAAAASFWFDSRQRSDNTADYVALDIESPAPLPLSLGDHVSVQGIVLPGRSVTSASTPRHSRPSVSVLIPVVPRGWRAGEASRLILHLHSASDLPGFRPTDPDRRWMLPERVLGRVQRQSRSLIVQSQFKKMGVLLTPDYKVLEVIPSQGGKPVQRSEDYLEIALWGAGAGSVFVLLMIVPAYFIARHRERAETARQAEAER
jgi:hypothetical protein